MLKGLARRAGDRRLRNRLEGARAEAAVDRAFRSRPARNAFRSIKRAARREGIAARDVDNFLRHVMDDAKARARAGRLFDFEADATAPLLFGASALNIGTFAAIRTPPMLLLAQGGPPVILANTGGGFIDPRSPMGQTITVIDMVLELLGAFLLFLNIVMPRINWGNLAQALNRLKEPNLSSHLLRLIQILGQLISEKESMEKILKAALDILKYALGTDTFLDLLKAGLDLSIWDWIKLVAQFVLLFALDGLSGGVAVAGKITLLLVTIYDVMKKAERLA